MITRTKTKGAKMRKILLLQFSIFSRFGCRNRNSFRPVSIKSRKSPKSKCRNRAAEGRRQPTDPAARYNYVQVKRSAAGEHGGQKDLRRPQSDRKGGFCPKTHFISRPRRTTAIGNFRINRTIPAGSRLSPSKFSSTAAMICTTRWNTLTRTVHRGLARN